MAILGELSSLGNPTPTVTYLLPRMATLSACNRGIIKMIFKLLHYSPQTTGFPVLKQKVTLTFRHPTCTIWIEYLAMLVYTFLCFAIFNICSILSKWKQNHLLISFWHYVNTFSYRFYNKMLWFVCQWYVKVLYSKGGFRGVFFLRFYTLCIS